MMQCEAIARTELAPLDLSKSAAFVIVPAVSTISSTRTTSMPVTSPITSIESTSFARLRVLLQITIGQSKYLA